MTAIQESAYNEAKGVARQLLDALAKAKRLRNKWDVNAWGEPEPDPRRLPDGDGNNTGITAANVGSVFFEVAQALDAVLDANNEAKRKILAKLD